MNTILFLLAATVSFDSGEQKETAFEAAAPARAARTFFLPEESPTGTLLGRIMPQRLANRGELRFQIVDGNPHGTFAIDGSTGHLTVSSGKALDFETHPRFDLTIAVSAEAPANRLKQNFANRLLKSGVGARTVDQLLERETQRVVVMLQDRNERPTVQSAAFRLLENAATGSNFGTVAASDPDRNDTLTFSIIGSDADGVIAIDAETGRFIVADGKRLDFEARRRYRLTVAVTDAGGLSDMTDIVVEVEDVNETPVITPATIAVADFREGTVLGRLSAGDPDGDSLTFQLMDDDTGVTIAPVTGELVVADVDQFAAYLHRRAMLNVQVTDSRGLTARCAAAIGWDGFDPRPAVARRPADSNAFPRVAAVKPDIADHEPAIALKPELTSGADPSLFTDDAPNALADAQAAEAKLTERGASVTLYVMVGFVLGGLTFFGLQKLGLLGGGRIGSDLQLPPLAEYGAEFERQLAELEAEYQRVEAENAALSQERTELQQRLAASERLCEEVREQFYSEAKALEQIHRELQEQREELHRRQSALDTQQGTTGTTEGESGDGGNELKPAADPHEELPSKFDPASGLEARATSPSKPTSRPPAKPEPVDDPRVSQLRSTLADAFGMELDVSDSPTTTEIEDSVESANSDSITDTANVGQTSETLSQSAAVAAVEAQDVSRDEAENGSADESPLDSVEAYMAALLKRTRGTMEQPASTQNRNPEPSPSTQAVRVAATKAGDSETTASAEELHAAEAVKTAAPIRPRPQIDKQAIRSNLDSMREVANLNARKAISTYARKRYRVRMLSCVVGTVACLGGAPLFIGRSSESLSNTGWTLLACGLALGGCTAVMWWLERRLVSSIKAANAQRDEEA